MAKATKKRAATALPKTAAPAKKRDAKKAPGKKLADKKVTKSATKKRPFTTASAEAAPPRPAPLSVGASAGVLDRLWNVIMSRRDADPAVSHSARLLSRGTAKVAQKFGEEAVECLIEAVSGNKDALIGESADVLYHLMVVWVAAGLRPDDVWAELHKREGISGVAEKASRARALPLRAGLNTTKIP